MKLLFITLNYPPSYYGGVSSSLYTVIESLSKNSSHEIRLLTTSYKQPVDSPIKYNEWVEQNNYKIKYIKTEWPLISIRYIINGIKMISKMDQLHLGSFFFFPVMIFTFTGLLYKKKIFISLNGEMHKPALKQKKWKKWFYIQLFKLMASKVVFRVTSLQEKDIVKEYFHKSMCVIIPNGFLFNELIKIDKKPQFIFLGRLAPIKALEKLIVACNKSIYFRKSFYDLYIVGPTENQFQSYANNLKKLTMSLNLGKNIKFFDEVYGSAKDSLLAESSFLFLISESENFGNVVIEALSQGTPVITSKGTPWQILEQVNCGYWIDNDIVSIAKIIDSIINLKENEYYEMSQNSIKFARENYNIEYIIGLWELIINGRLNPS